MKKILTLAMTLVLVLSLVACGGNQEPTTPNDTSAPTQTETVKPIKLKFCTLENEEHGQGVLLKTFKEKVESLSNGAIEVELYFNGSLYTQDGAIPALISGDLEMNLTSMQLTADYLPAISMFTATYMFKDYDHMRAVMDSEIGKQLANDVKDASGYMPIGYFYNGSRQLDLRTEKPVTKPEDLSSTILRMPNSEAWIAAGESLGAKVSPLAYGEVYTALQLGTIDAQDNPMPATQSSKFYEVTKQLCMTYHIIDCPMITVNAKVWDSMTEEQQGWMYEAANAAVAACDAQQLALEEDLVAFFEEQGLTITYPDIDAFSEYAYNYYVDKGLTAGWDMDLYNQIQAMAK